MSLFLGDIRIKTMLEVGLEDISKNDWLLNDVLGDTLGNQYLRERYGTQIASCKQWLANNRIYIFMSERDDKMEFPCITIEMGTSNEKSDMKHMADLSTQSAILYPNDINKPIPFVLKSTQGSYNAGTGVFTFASDVDLSAVAPGMILVNPGTGNGFAIQSVTMANQVNLMPNMSIPAGHYGIIPKFQQYEAKIGHTFMQETYKITCHALDQQTSLWLHSIAVYSLLRYRQVLLEKDGFAESMISSSKMYPNPDHSDGGQVIWSRDINLTGQVENRWYVQPHRFIEDIAFPGGIKIESNLNSTPQDLSNVDWVTIAESLEE